MHKLINEQSKEAEERSGMVKKKKRSAEISIDGRQTGTAGGWWQRSKTHEGLKSVKKN